MYRRYQPGPRNQLPKQGKPPAGEMEKIKSQVQQRPKMTQCQPMRTLNTSPAPKVNRNEKNQKGKNPILDILPAAVYNQETKKILGIFSAEDLLLVALIFLLLDSKESEDSAIVYLLLYVLLSDYIDLSFL